MELVIPEGTEHLRYAQRSEPKTAEEYAESCIFDFEAMRPYLIEGDCLDIGCGLGGFSALLAKHCGGKLHLLDGTGWTSGRRIGFGAQMDAYNDRASTEKLLKANGVTDFQWWDIGATELPPVSVVTSLISWGWHYPVSTYLPAVEEALCVGGILVLDIRPEQSGEKELHRSFEYVGTYQGFGKCNKTVWEKRG